MVRHKYGRSRVAVKEGGHGHAPIPPLPYIVLFAENNPLLTARSDAA